MGENDGHFVANFLLAWRTSPREALFSLRINSRLFK